MDRQRFMKRVAAAMAVERFRAVETAKAVALIFGGDSHDE